IFDSDDDNWTDWGSGQPFSCDTVGDCSTPYDFWGGESGDWHPYTLVNASQPLQEDGGGAENKKRLSVEMSTSCDGNVVTVSSGGDVSGARVYVVDASSLYDVALGNTDADGQLEFSGCGMTVKVHVSKSGYLPEDAEFSLVDCESCGQAVTGCTDDNACPDGKKCAGGECVAVTCGCGFVQGHACVEYACCSDSDCGTGQVCAEHSCMETPVAPECSSDADCGTTMECANGKCVEKPVQTPDEQAQADASGAMNDAQDAIDAAKADGKDTSEAEAKLEEAKAAFQQGNYEQAKDLAMQARTLAMNAALPVEPVVPEKPVAQQGGSWIGLVAMVLILAVVLGGAYWFVLRKKK
ncbi:MAG: hypothetical protein PHV13_06265, partial [Candidatus ainarchaeum sp.]|nr:hypothetical protein [Candidatus ainarchaeum sp.]